MATVLSAAEVQIEIVDLGVPLVVSIRDGRDVALVEGSAGELLALAQSIRAVVEASLRTPT